MVVFSEKHLHDISENATENLDDCITDVDNMKPKIVLKKRKNIKPMISPSKKKKVARRLFTKSNAVSSFIDKEAIQGYPYSIISLFPQNETRI